MLRKNCNLINPLGCVIIMLMKPIKVMRYGSKYSYGNSRRNYKKIAIIAVASILAVAAVVLAIVRLNSIDRSQSQADTLSLQMRDGSPAEISVTAGDACMLTMPSAIDMNEAEFESSDPSVVRVDAAGHVDALSAGKASVTASARNFTAVCEFTVAENTEPAYPAELTTAVKANEDILAANAQKGSDNLYSITVNRRTNTVTVYTYDDKGDYTVPVRSMVASCGTTGNDITVTGDFSIYFQEPWHPLYGDVYGMFVSGFEGPYLFHSVPYKTYSHDQLEAAEFNKLGTNASQGCVRMMVADVYWVWKNCPLNTPVHVIDSDASADPLGRPATVKIPANAVWDPTDNTEGNPFLGKYPTLEGVADAEIKKGAAFDPLAGITATDICGNDISDRVKITGEVLADKPGVYYLTYTVLDPLGVKTRADRTVTVTK